MYELYMVDPLNGSRSEWYDTVQEVVSALIKAGYQFKWSYRQGREVLHENEFGGIAQVFLDGREVTASLPMGRRNNMTVLY